MLEADAVAIADEASGGADRWIVESRREPVQPIRLRNRIVVEEGDDVAARHADADIARHSQVGFRAGGGPDLAGDPSELLRREVATGSVHPHHLERRIAQLAEARQRPLELFGTVERIDDD